MRLRFVALIAFAAFAASSLPARADTIYSSFGPAGTFETGNGVLIGGGSSKQVIASGFIPAETATLTNVVLPLAQFENTYSPINLYVESSSVGAPATILATLTQVGGFGTHFTLVDFECSSSCSLLDEGTLYYIVAQQSDPGTASVWAWTSTQIHGNTYYNNDGSPTGYWTQADYNPLNTLEVDGTPAIAAASTTPEPSSLILLGTGILGLAGATRGSLSIRRRTA